MYCRTIEQGQHFPSHNDSETHKFVRTIHTRIRFDNNTAHYLFSPTESEGRRCATSWNMAWGATRCGFNMTNHDDSDRFVWRRAVSCFIFDSQGHVIGEKANCSEANLIEIAAYAYDGGRKPFQHQGTLLKEFTTKVRVDKWVKLTLIFESTSTIYRLSDDYNRPLETLTIEHRNCKQFRRGIRQSFYFGGVCAAPQPVSVCYKIRMSDTPH